MKGGLLLNKFFKGIGFYLVIFIIIVGIVQFSGKPTQKVETLEFSKVYRELTNENISRLYFVSDTAVEGTIKDSNTKFRSYVPKEIMGDTLSKEVLDQAKEGKIVFGGEAKPSTPWFVELLPTLLLIFFMVILWFVFMNQSQGGGGRVMNFGKSKAKVHKDDEKTRVTFKEVAGLNEEKEDLQEVVDFLKNPKKYIELGARIPKGILMVGPPGTGKTYLSRAVAGEAGVPFFSISGSDFVEMFVGVGASRVRDLFEQAKKNAPAIIFIDEIDAVGRKRGAGLGGGHDEREQTLNQLLVEMDGFGVNQGIIIMAATNRPDILDPALLRPGRFDRQIVVGAPDVKGREAIFKVHSKNKPLADDVNIEVLARRTPGFTPADIENLMNEAAILTARKREKKIHMETIEEAITKVIAGVAKKSRVISEPERKLTAYHEAGHAVCAHVLPHVSPVHQVTIVPRGRAGGFTMQLPVEDKFYATKNEMKENIVVLLGGRVAEELTLDDISTGASNDLERVSATARNMVTKYGMSEKLGPMTFGDSDDEVFLGNSFASKQNYSEEVAYEIDKEIGRIVDESYKQTKKILQDNMDRLEYVAKALLVYETLDAEQFLKAFIAAKDIPGIDDSTLPMCYPGENNGVIEQWVMWYILELEMYLKRRKDNREYFKSFCYKYINYLSGFDCGNGLITRPKGWNFIEWSDANEFAEESDISYPTNMLYARVLEAVGNIYDDAQLNEKAAKVKKCIVAKSFNGEYFCDGAVLRGNEYVNLPNTSEACQYYAAFTGTAYEENADYNKFFDNFYNVLGYARKLERKLPEVAFANLFIGFTLRFMYLLNNGKFDRLLNEITEFYGPMAKQTGTLWEQDTPIASLNHGLSSVAAVLIIKGLTGISEINEADKTITVKKSDHNRKYKISVGLTDGMLYAENDGNGRKIRVDGEYKVTEV